MELVLFLKETSKNHRMGRVRVAPNEDKYAHILPAGTSAQRGADSSFSWMVPGEMGHNHAPFTHAIRAEWKKNHLPVP